jgi:hypothetical protein
MSAGARVAACALTAMLASGFGMPAVANQVIPAGGATLVASGLVDLACTDLLVDGTLNTGTGTYVKVRNVTVGPTGVVLGNGTINYSGTLSNGGVIQPGVTMAVNTACGVPAELPIPTMSHWMLMALAGLLLCLAGAVLNGHGVLRRRGIARGVTKLRDRNKTRRQSPTSRRRDREASHCAQCPWRLRPRPS